MPIDRFASLEMRLDQRRASAAVGMPIAAGRVPSVTGKSDEFHTNRRSALHSAHSVKEADPCGEGQLKPTDTGAAAWHAYGDTRRNARGAVKRMRRPHAVRSTGYTTALIAVGRFGEEGSPVTAMGRDWIGTAKRSRPFDDRRGLVNGGDALGRQREVVVEGVVEAARLEEVPDLRPTPLTVRSESAAR